MSLFSYRGDGLPKNDYKTCLPYH